MKRIEMILAASALLGAGLGASSCQEGGPAVPAPALLTLNVVEEDRDVPTRSLLTAPDIETKKTCVTLAAYTDGMLACVQDYSTSLTAMPMELAAGTYNVYALVNMGALSSSIPVSESSLASFTYDIPSYESIASMGMPMAGSGTFEVSASTGGTRAVSVKRLLARVETDLSCDWPGAVITGATVHNLNKRMKPFSGGGSAAASASQVLSDVEIHGTAAGNSSSLSAVFYVPENLQGNVPGVSNSSDKRPDGGNGTVYSKRDVLTFLEVSVSGSGMYSGEVTYRSYLGSNSTSNFDIVRNTRYLWTVDYHEDGLQTDNWKADTGGLDDKRAFAWNADPIYITPGQSVTFTDHFSTNITSGLSITLSGAELSDVVASSTDTGFTVSSDAGAGQSVTATAIPSHNQISSLFRSAAFIVQRRVAEWAGYDPLLYASEGKKVYVWDGSTVKVSNQTRRNVMTYVKYWLKPGGSHTQGKGEAQGQNSSSKEWRYTSTSGSSGLTMQNYTNSSSLSGNPGHDRLEYYLGNGLHPGDYAVNATLKDGGTSDVAYIRIPENRYVYLCCMSNRYYKTRGTTINDEYYSNIKVWMETSGTGTLVISGSGSNRKYTLPVPQTGSQDSYNNSTPVIYLGDYPNPSLKTEGSGRVYFDAGDQTVWEEPYRCTRFASSSVLYGSTIDSDGMADAAAANLDIICPSGLDFSSGPAFSTYFTEDYNYSSFEATGAYLSGTLRSLPMGGIYDIIIRFKENPEISAVYHLNVPSTLTYNRHLELTPATATIARNTTFSFDSLDFTETTYNNGFFQGTTETSLALDNSRVTWSSSDTSVATVTGGVVSGISSGSATITARYRTSSNTYITTTATVTVTH